MKTIDKTEFGLPEEDVKKISKVFSLFPEVEEVVVFGSRAKGNYKSGSDIDLAFKGEKITHNILNKISVKLDELLLPYIIETTLYRNIDNEDLIEHINRRGKIFYNIKQ